MNNIVQTRVLAYTMAKEISEDELKEVAGGGVIMSHHGTFQPSGGGIWDTVIDVTIDTIW